MKKTLSILLALALLLCCMPALAEETEYIPYTHPDGTYSVEYPSSLMLMDAETADYIAALSEEIDLGLNFDVSAYAESIKNSNTAVFLDFIGNNVSITQSDMGVYFSPEDLLEVGVPVVREQFASLLECEFYDEGSLRQYGENRFTRMGMTYMLGSARNYEEQYMICFGSTAYFLTFTFVDSVDQGIVEHMLASFKVNTK